MAEEKQQAEEAGKLTRPLMTKKMKKSLFLKLMRILSGSMQPQDMGDLQDCWQDIRKS